MAISFRPPSALLPSEPSAPHPPRRRGAWIGALGKPLVSILLIGYMASRIDGEALADGLSGLAPVPIVAAVVLLMLQAPLFALRWIDIAARLGGHIRFGAGLRMVMVGLFFNQTLPSSVGGDAVRIWYASRSGLPLRVAVNSVLLERLTGLLALALILAAALPFAWDSVSGATMRALLLAILSAVLVATWLAHQIDRLPAALTDRPVLREIARISIDLRVLSENAPALARSMALGAASGGLAIAAVAVLGKAAGIELGFGGYAALVPAVILFTVVPVSLAGWGVREGAMVVLFGAAGVAAESAFLVSLLFGVCLLVAAVPGCVIWLLQRAAGAKPPVEPDGGAPHPSQGPERSL